MVKSAWYLMRLFLLSLVFLAHFNIAYASPQSDSQLLHNILSSWKVVSDNVKVGKVISKKIGNGVRTVGGNITAFGQNARIEVDFYSPKKKQNSASGSRAAGAATSTSRIADAVLATEDKDKFEIRRIYIKFPKKVKLSTNHFRALFKVNASSILPGSGGANIRLKEFQLEVLNRRIQGGLFAVSFGSWYPLGPPKSGGDVVKLSEVSLNFGITGIQTSPQPQLTAELSSYLYLPKNLARTLGIGATSLEMTGSVTTKPVTIKLGANLASDEIPLDKNHTVVMKNAKILFIYEGGKPSLALAGTMQVRPPRETPLDLNGQVSIAVTGSVYAEGWMTQGNQWNNPLGISRAVTINRLGLGFGANFATGIPTPILALEGGIQVRTPSGRNITGRVTLGIDTGNPTRNMIDAELGSLSFSDFLQVFAPGVSAPEVRNTLSQITLNKLRLSVVPPGPGLTLFGVNYAPGMTAEADIQFGSFTGSVYISIDDSGVEAFGAMTPIQARDFALTGTRPGTGPYLYLAIKPAQRMFVMAINGKLKVLGSSSATDIYISDAGFNATVTSSIMAGFSTKLDIAGTALNRNATLYAEASLTDRNGFVQQITEQASRELEKAARNTNADFLRKQRALESLRPRLNAKKQELTRRQNEVRIQYRRLCAKLDQRRKLEADKRSKERIINQLKQNIRYQESDLNRKHFSSARRLGSLNCPRGYGSYGGYCWGCRGGTKHDILQRWDSPKACFMAQPFPRPPKYYRATRANKISCGRSDVRDMGYCWRCPRGYQRKVSFHRIDSSKACEMSNYNARAGEINRKKLELVSREAELTVILRGLGRITSELSRASANVCQAVNNTDLINTNPRVAPLFQQWAALSLQVVEGQQALNIMRQTLTGSLNTAAWITRNAGRGLKVVHIKQASFKGCVSTLNNGNVALHVKGLVAGSPFEGTFDVNLKSPTAGIQDLARMLNKTRSPRARGNNGRCRRPDVPRPRLAGTRIGDKLNQLSSKHHRKKARPVNKVEPKPEWAKGKAQRI